MNRKGADVVIIGGGVAGMATAYFLAAAGVKSVVVERDSIGSHASGFAYGGLSPLGETGVPFPNSLLPISTQAMRHHGELSKTLPEETGVDTQFRPKPSLGLAFTEREVERAKANLVRQLSEPGYEASWLEAEDVRSAEPAISPDVLGALLVKGTAEVDPYRFVLALTQGAEKLGASVRMGRAVGLKQQSDRVCAVVLEHDELACEAVVLAMGPWTCEASSWLGAPVEISPLKGQILRVDANSAHVGFLVGWAGNYVTTKPDGLLWAGTTEERVGFDENPTAQARDSIMESLLRMVPSAADARLVQQTACLRPVSPDRMPVVGRVPGRDNVYIATGGGRKGILLGPALGSITADLITTGATDVPIEDFALFRSG